MDTSRRPIWIALAWAAATGALGMASAVGVGPWYWDLRRPWFQPPDWVFGPAWGAIFALSAWAFVRAWREGGRGGLLLAYACNGLLNAGWAWLFFGMRRIGWAMIEVVPLLLSCLVLVILCGRRDRLAGWLNVPYLLWVGFAAVLNWALWRLNGSFA